MPTRFELTNSLPLKVRTVLSSVTTCQILLAEDIDTGALIVIKHPKAGRTQTAQDLAILPTLSHPSIINLISEAPFLHVPAAVFRYAPDGDLHEQLHGGSLSEQTVKHIMTQLFDAVAYLHRTGVWHRDLKPANILVWNSDIISVVITDFGLVIRPCVATLCDAFQGM
jgi:serine/threonine protein kinase